MNVQECKDQNIEMETRVARIVDTLEKSLRTNPPSVPPPKLNSWRSIAVIIGVITAIAAPVLTMTWYTSDSINTIESVSEDVDEVKREVGSMKKEMQLFRETLILYTRHPIPISNAGLLGTPNNDTNR